MTPLSLVLLTALAGRPTPDVLQAARERISDNGRELYALADRVAAHQAACHNDPQVDAALMRGYLDTYISVAWKMPRKKVTACQEAVLDLFRCQEKVSCAEVLALASEEDHPDPCAAERAVVAKVCQP